MQNRYVCIHAHFYQPPRENPWLETIEVQDSASPFHDWNERISAECYRPNGLARVLDADGWVARLSNNYARISFNFGPTVLQWMERGDEPAYKAILDGDRQSRKRFGGHGSAIAQVYNHIIMPLANRRDRETQVKWGLSDFEKRFGRTAEAIWLPETVVDTETLEILADHGMKFVILAPRQAKSVRDREREWQDVTGEKIDPRQPYAVNLPGGKSIAAFFYDGPISKAVAFEGVLNNGGQFADRLMQGFNDDGGPQLVHIATDGESYGHHHRHGEMALAYALDDIERNNKAEIVNYALYLEKFPPQREAEIYDNSSWSCVHGVGRWKEDCGCNSGMKPGWTQGWRAPFREAMDLLRDSLSGPYERFMSQYNSDPWAMRDDYINVVLDRSPDNVQAFLTRWLKAGEKDPQPVLKALEMQRNLMLAYTSCAWFFDEVSGIETVQNMQYAARTIELAHQTVCVDPEPAFLEILRKAQSNIHEQQNGAEIYKRFAQPARLDFPKIAAHIAALTLFTKKPENSSLYCFDFKWGSIERNYSGKAQIICAHLQLTSQITLESRDFQFVIVHLGDHNLTVGVSPYAGEETYNTLVAEFMDIFGDGDVMSAVRLLDKHFEGRLYSLNDLFRDKQKKIVNAVFSRTLVGVEEQLSSIYEQNYPVMRFMSDIHVPLGPAFSHIAHLVQNRHILTELEAPEFSVDDIGRIVSEARDWHVDFDVLAIDHVYKTRLRILLDSWLEDRGNEQALAQLMEYARIKDYFPFRIDLGEIQNEALMHIDTLRESGDAGRQIAEKLHVRI